MILFNFEYSIIPDNLGKKDLFWREVILVHVKTFRADDALLGCHVSIGDDG